MTRERYHKGARGQSRLWSATGRWCLSAAVSGIAGTLSLLNAALGKDEPLLNHYCEKSATPPCSSCPKTPTTSSTACSSYLNGWNWGICVSTDSDVACTKTDASCTYVVMCKANHLTGDTCSGGGTWTRCQ
jgi:hypothetical protein